LPDHALPGLTEPSHALPYHTAPCHAKPNLAQHHPATARPTKPSITMPRHT